MKILFATAELAPLVRVGGLAEAASGLIRELRNSYEDDFDIEVVLPDYSMTRLDGPVLTTPLMVPSWASPAVARRGHLPGFGDITLVDVPLMRRPHPYTQPNGDGWHDNDRRFLAFSSAIAALAVDRGSDVVHLNDWHTAAALAWIPQNVPTVLSIHNLQYQGQCHPGWLSAMNDQSWAYERSGSCNPLAGGIQLAWRVIAVSPTYAKEITTPENGFGLDDALRAKNEALIGIRNGIDTSEWNPATDPALPAPYRSSDFRAANPVPKAAARERLRAEVSIEATAGPLLGSITRLVDQKGIDIIGGLVPYLQSVDAQMIILGSGDAGLATWLKTLARSYPDRLAFVERFDVGLAHRITAGADLYLMPSKFEPCGLAQMQAMAYGTIPVTTRVGGLCDTVFDDDDNPEIGNGFSALDPNLGGMIDAVHRATRAWNERRRRVRIVQRGMRADWSWRGPAEAYADLYFEIGAHSPNA